MTTLSLGIQRVGSRDEPIALVVSSLTSVGGVAEMLAGAFALDAQRLRLLFNRVALRSEMLLDNIDGLSSGATLNLLVLPPPAAVLVRETLPLPPASNAETAVVVNAAHRQGEVDGDGLVTAVMVDDAGAAASGALVTAIPLSPEEVARTRQLSGFAFPIEEEDAAIPIVHMAMVAAHRGDNAYTDLPEGVAVSMAELEALGAAYATPTSGPNRAAGCSQSPPRTLARRRWGDAPSVTRGCYVPLCPFLPKLAVELLVGALFAALLINAVDPQLLGPATSRVNNVVSLEYDAFYIGIGFVFLGMIGIFVCVFVIPAFVAKANATTCYRVDAATQSIRADHWVMGVYALNQLYPCCTPQRTLSLRFREIRAFHSTFAPVRVPSSVRQCILRTVGALRNGGCICPSVAAGRAAERNGGGVRGRSRNASVPSDVADARRGSRSDAIDDLRGGDSDCDHCQCRCYTLSVQSTSGAEAPLFWGSAEAVARKQGEWESYLRSVGWPDRLDNAASMAMRVDQGPPPGICTLGRTCNGARCASNPSAEAGNEIVYWQYSTQRCVRLGPPASISLACAAWLRGAIAVLSNSQLCARCVAHTPFRACPHPITTQW